MRRASAMQGQACTELKTKRERKGDEGPDEGRQAVRLTSSADSPSPTLGGLALPHYIPTGNRASTSVANHHQSAGVKQYVKRFVKQYVQQMLNQSSVSSSTWYLIYIRGVGDLGRRVPVCLRGCLSPRWVCLISVHGGFGVPEGTGAKQSHREVPPKSLDLISVPAGQDGQRRSPNQPSRQQCLRRGWMCS